MSDSPKINVCEYPENLRVGVQASHFLTVKLPLMNCSETQQSVSQQAESRVHKTKVMRFCSIRHIWTSDFRKVDTKTTLLIVLQF